MRRTWTRMLCLKYSFLKFLIVIVFVRSNDSSRTLELVNFQFFSTVVITSVTNLDGFCDGFGFQVEPSLNLPLTLNIVDFFIRLHHSSVDSLRCGRRDCWLADGTGRGVTWHPPNQRLLEWRFIGVAWLLGALWLVLGRGYPSWIRVFENLLFDQSKMLRVVHSTCFQ